MEAFFMKRVILGSLLSCMLVGQVFGMDQAVVVQDPAEGNAQSGPLSVLGDFAKGIVYGFGTTATTVVSGSCIVAAATFYAQENTSDNAASHAKNKGDKIYQISPGLILQEIGRSEPMKAGIFNASMLAGIGYNLYQSGSILRSDNLTWRKGAFAIGRVLGSFALSGVRLTISKN